MAWGTTLAAATTLLTVRLARQWRL